MAEYKNISNLKFGLGYLPAVVIGSIIFFYGEYCNSSWLATGGLVILMTLIVATTLIWRRVLRIKP